MEHQESARLSQQSTPRERPFLVRGQFFDFDQFAESVRNWDLDFRQLDSGSFRGHVLQIGLRGVQLGRARFGRRLHQRGAPPSGMRTFVIPGDERQEFEWRGHQITPNRLMVFPSESGLESHSRPGFSVFTLSIDEAHLGLLASELELPYLDQMLKGSEAIDLPAGTMKGLRRRAREICQTVESAPNLISESALQSELESLLPIHLLLKIASTRGFEGQSHSAQKRRALEKAMEYLAEHVNEPISVRGLCTAARSSERTLRRAFLEEFGVAPSRYLRAIRLRGVRRQLQSTSPDRAQISDIANLWGFWHMGQFAADYRRQFGELPSETLQPR